MEVKFKFSIFNKIMTKTGGIGIVTNLGVNISGTPMLWVVYNDMNIKDTWEVEASCNSAPNSRAKSTHVDFYFDILDNVKAPLCEGVITYMDYNEDEKISCVVTNSERGVSNDWWPASSLKLIVPVVDEVKKEANTQAE